LRINPNFRIFDKKQNMETQLIEKFTQLPQNQKEQVLRFIEFLFYKYVGQKSDNQMIEDAEFWSKIEKYLQQKEDEKDILGFEAN